MEKKLKKKVNNFRQENHRATLKIWSMDEHRVGLKPIYRKIRAERGINLTATINWKYKWLWVYGFVHPQSGETYFWLLPKVNITLFKKVLDDFACEFKISKNNQVILILDQAGWHISKNILNNLPEGLHLEFLPAYSPELQPAERLWPILDEPIANRSFENLDELEELIYHRCRSILSQPKLVKGLTNYHWWPQTDLFLTD